MAHDNAHASKHSSGGSDEITSPIPLAGVPAITQSAMSEGSTDIETTSTAYVDMGPSVTMTTGANPVPILFSATLGNTTKEESIYSRIVVDATNENGAISCIVKAGGCATQSQVILKTLSAGPHTIKAQWKTSGGTMSNFPATSPTEQHRRLVVVELKK